MNMQRIVGAAILVVGVVLLCVGINASNSVADQVKHSFTGRFTQETAWYIYGGLTAALVGLFMTIAGLGGKGT